jgi:hypothetical protein
MMTTTRTMTMTGKTTTAPGTGSISLTETTPTTVTRMTITGSGMLTTGTTTMTDDLVKRWDDYVESMGSVMGDVEHMAQKMRDRIEALTAQLESTLRDRKLILEERDRTFALMLARSEKAEADNARLRKLLTEAAADLTAYVGAEYPPDTCAEYPQIAKRHHRDMELVRYIEAALTAKEPSHE